MNEEISKEHEIGFAKRVTKEYTKKKNEEAEGAKAKAYVEEVCNKSDGKATTGHADLNGETVEVIADGTAKENISKEFANFEKAAKAERAAKQDKPKAPSIRGNLKLINKLIRTVVEEESRRIALGDSIKESIDLINGKIGQLEVKFSILETNEPKDKMLVVDADRVTNLEKCIAKMAHYTGGNNPRICKEFGIENYEVKLKDMSKFAITSG